jgi:hypothetical protein
MPQLIFAACKARQHVHDAEKQRRWLMNGLGFHAMVARRNP